MTFPLTITMHNLHDVDYYVYQGEHEDSREVGQPAHVEPRDDVRGDDDGRPNEGGDNIDYQ